MTREGGCFCGAVRYRVNGESRSVTHCHCRHCRLIHGAAFVTWAEFDDDHFEMIRGNPSTFESRAGATRSFCPSCGTPLFFRDAETPRVIDVAACTLDDPSDLIPGDHTFASRRLPWIRLADGLPAYEERRTRR